MKFSYFHLTILLLIFPLISFAQKETNIWYFGDKAGLDFNFDPPKILHNSALKSHEGSSVISDKNGKLLFYTNGETVWNRLHEIMDNGTELGGDNSSRQAAVIVPKPNEEGLYYIFTVDAVQNNYIKGLRYSIVNTTANNGMGKVTEKGELLHAPSTEGLSVVGNCREDAEREYWVLAAKKDDKGKIYAYKIDKNGIDKKPVISSISSISSEGNIEYIKFSPAGNKVAILEERKEAGEDKYVFIGDFDFGSGLINNVLAIKVEATGYFNQVEFSPNGKLLYISSGNSIKQIDLNTQNYQIISSVETNMYIMGEFQIAPDGNIYIASFSRNFLSIIKNSNERGLSGRYFEHYVDLGKESLLGLPNFVRNFLYNNFTTYAGKDSLICSNEPLQLGRNAETGVSYKWHPSIHLNKNNIANPIFNYTNNSSEIQKFEYILTASDEVCSRTDTVKIEVYPAPPEKIIGSKSVCPGVTGVAYHVSPNNYVSWHWEVSGGTIAEGQGTSQITVDWGPSNPDAYVKLIATSTVGCGIKNWSCPCVSMLNWIQKPRGGHMRFALIKGRTSLIQLLKQMALCIPGR